MPQLTNTKWEAFAQGIASQMRVLDAYEYAGYQRNPSAASQLKARPEIQARIQELLSEKGDIARRDAEEDLDNLPSDLNREWLIKTLMKNVQIAQTAHQIAPANKAVEMLAQIIGINFKAKPSQPGDDPEEGVGDAPDGFDFDKATDAIGRMMQALPPAPAATGDEPKTSDETKTGNGE